MRPLDEGDHPAIRAFLDAEAPWEPVPAWGLLGKLVGNLVAVLGIDLTPTGIRIASLVVARDLRRKRVGRLMLRELESLARKMDRTHLVVDPPPEAREFFLRSGYHDSDGQMVMTLNDA
ncbi:MAG TPA: GNAT family N-acetyltransferase [Thermoanaerobaculia bacterium]|nr:GNAT family N-acetyltransferase [Thermoanaerobaculia bacterium]